VTKIIGGIDLPVISSIKMSGAVPEATCCRSTTTAWMPSLAKNTTILVVDVPYSDHPTPPVTTGVIETLKGIRNATIVIITMSIEGRKDPVTAIMKAHATESTCASEQGVAATIGNPESEVTTIQSEVEMIHLKKVAAGTRRLTWKQREMVTVTDDGEKGVNEAASEKKTKAMTGIGNDTAKETVATIKSAATVMTGEIIEDGPSTNGERNHNNESLAATIDTSNSI
jgi:hypothetical protein